MPLAIARTDEMKLSVLLSTDSGPGACPPQARSPEAGLAWRGASIAAMRRQKCRQWGTDWSTHLATAERAGETDGEHLEPRLGLALSVELERWAQARGNGESERQPVNGS